jgi:putative copper export protein
VIAALLAVERLAPALDGLRLSLHVLGAAIWVGGQLTVAGLLGTVRGLGSDAPKKVARAFGRLQWPAFALLVATGFWNISSSDARHTTAWSVVLALKITAVAIAGASAYLHQRSRSRTGLAAFGALTGISSLAALVLGVFLAG